MTLPVRDWREHNRWIADLLKERTGDDVEVWNARMPRGRLRRRGGFASVARRPRGYRLPAIAPGDGAVRVPGVLPRERRRAWSTVSTATGQHLRTILDAILAQVATLGEVTVQTRKTYVSLVTPKRTFAAVQPTTRSRVDLGLRLANQPPTGRTGASVEHWQQRRDDSDRSDRGRAGRRRGGGMAPTCLRREPLVVPPALVQLGSIRP